MITCSRRLHFCAGHRVLGHENKCANPHGHNYVVWIHAQAPSLDAIGRVIDFSVLKAKVGGWLDRWWDHTFLVSEQDEAMVDVLIRSLPGQNKAPFICTFNPTAEEMARFLLKTVCPEVLEGTGVQVVRVEIYETENCMAEASL
jgi:6-pyruvoyltetrahydropterin/6-carboxytetrahydropterin synthase